MFSNDRITSYNVCYTKLLRCIKDMAGLVSPYDIYNLIKEIKSFTDVPLNLHTHFTSGMGDLAIFKAIEAGVDIVDTVMAPYAYRTSHTAVEPIVMSLLGTDRDRITSYNVCYTKLLRLYRYRCKFVALWRATPL